MGSLFGKKKTPTLPRQRGQVAGRPQAFSYYAKRTEQQYNVGRAQPRDQDVRRREQIIRFWRQRLSVVVLGAVVIVCCVYILSVSSNAKIVTLTAGSNDAFLQSNEVYARAANDLLGASPLNSNKVTIDTDGIAQKLQQKFPELSSVSIAMPLMGHRPLIYVAPKAPAFVLSANQEMYVLDMNGKALLTTAQLSNFDTSKLITVQDKNSTNVTLGKEALPSTTVSFIKYIVDELSAKNIAVNEISLPQVPYELDVRLQGSGYYVKFNLHDYRHVKEQVGTMLAMQGHIATTGVVPSDYIDVRIVGRAYYK